MRTPPTGTEEPYIRNVDPEILGAVKDKDVELDVTTACSLDIFGLNRKLSRESKLRTKLSQCHSYICCSKGILLV